MNPTFFSFFGKRNEAAEEGKEKKIIMEFVM